jgi:predicted DCC family thiol-disulfide oxidoreductase YuxK
VIVFDGECHFCSAWVRFVLQNDAQGAFRFVPRQSDAARRLLAAVGVVPDALGSIALISGRTVVTRSDAVLRIFARLAFPWCLVSWLVVIPHPLRDFAYAWVARNRYRLSSRRTQCRLVGPDESDRFLR